MYWAKGKMACRLVFGLQGILEDLPDSVRVSKHQTTPERQRAGKNVSTGVVIRRRHNRAILVVGWQLLEIILGDPQQKGAVQSIQEPNQHAQEPQLSACLCPERSCLRLGMLKRPRPFPFSMADSLPCHIWGLSFFPKTQSLHFQGKVF